VGLELEKLGWAGIELVEEIGQEMGRSQEQKKACSEQTQPGPIAVGCMNTTLRSDSCLGLMYNADVVTAVHIVMEVQIFVKRSFQEEMMPDAVDTDIAVDSTAVIVHESAAKRRKVEVTMEFLKAHDN
jgi:hypothetical protein